MQTCGFKAWENRSCFNLGKSNNEVVFFLSIAGQMNQHFTQHYDQYHVGRNVGSLTTILGH